MAKNLKVVEAEIPVSSSESGVVTVPNGLTLIGMHIPANIVPTSMKFKAAVDGNATARLVKSAGNTDYTVTMTTLTAAYFALDPNSFLGVSHLSLLANTNQTGTVATISLVFGQV